MKLSIYQGCGVLGDVSSNINLMEDNILLANKNNSQLVIFPELFPTGYNLPSDKLKKITTEIDQKQLLSQLSEKYNIALICGFSGIDERGKLENLCGFWNEKGDLLHQHKKVFLWGEESKYFSGGNQFKVFEWNGSKIGICICFDIEFPESVRELAVNEAKLIFCASSAMDDYNISRVMIPTRAMENQIFVIYCNRSGIENGLEYFGESVVASPKGNILQKFTKNEEGIKTLEIDMSDIRKTRELFSYTEILKGIIK